VFEAKAARRGGAAIKKFIIASAQSHDRTYRAARRYGVPMDTRWRDPTTQVNSGAFPE
jgi:hypothetical protein